MAAVEVDELAELHALAEEFLLGVVGLNQTQALLNLLPHFLALPLALV